VASATQAGHSSLLQANDIAAPVGASVLPEVDGVPCTGLNTGKCIGLQAAGQKAGPAA
jgi:hypothetical protein